VAPTPAPTPRVCDVAWHVIDERCTSCESRSVRKVGQYCYPVVPAGVVCEDDEGYDVEEEECRRCTRSSLEIVEGLCLARDRIKIAPTPAPTPLPCPPNHYHNGRRCVECERGTKLVGNECVERTIAPTPAPVPVCRRGEGWNEERKACRDCRRGQVVYYGRCVEESTIVLPPACPRGEGWDETRRTDGGCVECDSNQSVHFGRCVDDPEKK
jgi:hypothetical protein